MVASTSSATVIAVTAAVAAAVSLTLTGVLWRAAAALAVPGESLAGKRRSAVPAD
jgi:hypothetical protein